MKLLDVVIQTVMLFFGALGAINEIMIGFYILPIFGLYQLISALVHRVAGVKSKSRNIYWVLAAITLFVLGYGIVIEEFNVIGTSMIMGALTGTFYTIICWREIPNPGISNHPHVDQPVDESS